MTELHTIDELLTATGGQVLNAGAVKSVSGVSIDSRDISPGDLFAAIKGDVHDGHKFVAAALDAGAALALVSNDWAGEFAGRPLLVVPDVLKALEDIGKHARARSNAQIVAVTGSAGKTTTKELIRTILEPAGKTHASIKSFNNHWGVPLMLARLPRDAEFGVFELGMNHAGEIEALTAMVRPHVAVVTTVAAAHLDAFDSVEQIALAKAEIFSGLEPDGAAVVNIDHGYSHTLIEAARMAGAGSVVTCGFSAEADVRMMDARSSPAGVSVRIDGLSRPVQLELQVSGRHMQANATLALCVADLLGVDVGDAVTHLRAFTAPGGRGSVELFGEGERQFCLIDESYNANPASMAAALDVFSGIEADGRKILVLGDMLELGRESDALHAELLVNVTEAGADEIYLVGSHMRALAAALGGDRVAKHVETGSELNEHLLKNLALGDTLMIKGSNGVGLGALVRLVRAAFTKED